MIKKLISVIVRRSEQRKAMRHNAARERLIVTSQLAIFTYLRNYFSDRYEGEMLDQFSAAITNSLFLNSAADTHIQRFLEEDIESAKNEVLSQEPVRRVVVFAIAVSRLSRGKNLSSSEFTGDKGGEFLGQYGEEYDIGEPWVAYSFEFVNAQVELMKPIALKGNSEAQRIVIDVLEAQKKLQSAF